MAPKKETTKKGTKEPTKKEPTKKPKKEKQPKATPAPVPGAPATGGAGGDKLRDPALIPFEAGSVFAKYDLDGDGKLDKHEFTQLVKEHPNIIQ